MVKQIEQLMRQVKLDGMAKGWRSIFYENNEQYVTGLHFLIEKPDFVLNVGTGKTHLATAVALKTC